jgi:hypothetical protein
MKMEMVVSREKEEKMMESQTRERVAHGRGKKRIRVFVKLSPLHTREEGLLSKFLKLQVSPPFCFGPFFYINS